MSFEEPVEIRKVLTIAVGIAIVFIRITLANV